MPPVPLLVMGPLPRRDLDALGEAFEVHRWWDVPHRDAFLAATGQGIRAVATDGGLGLPRAVMDRLPELEVVSIFGVGFDAVDVEEARRRGIAVGNTPGVLTGDVADLAVGLILAAERGLVGADAWARTGAWASGPFPLGRRVHGRRAGILGLGRIGEAVARRLAAFDMDVAYTSRSRKDVPWEWIEDPVALAARSDILVVAVAASDATRHIVDARVIEALGPDGLLVNVARAAVVDEAALLDALESGRLRAAALDVFENEPRLDPRWTRLSNVLLSPHAGSATVETRAAMGDLMRENLLAHVAGRPLPARVV